MARALRVERPGGRYHVTSRGNASPRKRKGSAHGMVRFSFVRGIALRCSGSFPHSAVQ